MGNRVHAIASVDVVMGGAALPVSVVARSRQPTFERFTSPEKCSEIVIAICSFKYLGIRQIDFNFYLKQSSQ
jgi:hypothetical protein